MSDASLLLGNTLQKQNEILGELFNVVMKQKEALKEGRIADIQSLMSELRHVSVRCQAIEAKRVRAATDLAQSVGSEPVISEILKALPEDDGEGAALVEQESKKLLQLVQKLKIEMSLISRLMDEAKTLNEMLISEWQKLSAKSLGAGSMGTFDAKI